MTHVNMQQLVALTPDELLVHTDDVPTLWLKEYLAHHIKEAKEELAEEIAEGIEVLLDVQDPIFDSDTMKLTTHLYSLGCQFHSSEILTLSATLKDLGVD